MSQAEAGFEAAREAVLSTLQGFAENEPSVEALWLQGSLATGGADPWSDIDAYLAFSDSHFEAAWANRAGLLQRLGPSLAWSDATTPGLKAVHALMDGGARLDLFFEAASQAPALARPAAKALVDKTGLVARLNLGWSAPTAQVARSILTIIRMTRQGASWPLRLLGRGQWSRLATVELDLINAQVAQLMAVSHDPSNFYRNPNALAPLLTEAERAELDALTTDALAALIARDQVALKPVHLRIGDALVAHGKAACATLGVDYPISDESEAAVRALIERAWPG
ncbi:MAG TPA: nucleotidyltransferase domain-containing protein [Caulobacteraceae bacterium]|jgi:predicted nucleotidyltransferase